MDHPPNFEPSTGDDAPRAVEPPTRVESIDLYGPRKISTRASADSLDEAR